MSRVLFVGNVAYAQPVHDALRDALPSGSVLWAHPHPGVDGAQAYCGNEAAVLGLGRLDLIVVAGWRRLLPPSWLALAPAVGFHSAKLPEYPGRAPVPWTLLRGDREAWNTMFYLDAGVDTGDIIDERSRPIVPGDTPASIYEWVGESSVDMLLANLQGLLDGTAPRRPQDPARRGPLTTPDGWDRYWLAQQADGFG